MFSLEANNNEKIYFLFFRSNIEMQFTRTHNIGVVTAIGAVDFFLLFYLYFFLQRSRIIHTHSPFIFADDRNAVSKWVNKERGRIKKREKNYEVHIKSAHSGK